MKKNNIVLQACIVLFALLLTSCGQAPKDIDPNAVIPTPRQVEYQQMEFIGFIHFTVNTFTDKEWGYGDESPEIFNPTEFDADQWARAAKHAGMKQLILTAKHHDGFCLWPSKYTEHSVKNSPWKNGKGDIVREFVDACRRHGLKVGLYLSPWDRNHADYGTPAYIEYYRNQLRELLAEYGEISEIWFDGANGGTGYYGGARETRHIDRTTYYRWSETWAMIKKLQPNALLFSDAGPDIRWIGNERGYAGQTNWSTINSETIVVGGADPSYLNSGDPDGKNWVVPLCDTSIRPGWFYHQQEDSRVKTTQQLLDVYYNSVGRNGVLLLNIPPDRRGLFHENDIQALLEFRSILNETFQTNLALGKKVSASSSRQRNDRFFPTNVVDENLDSYWATDDHNREATLEIDLGEPKVFDRILIQEPIRFGQRISEFEIKGLVNGEWTQLAKGTTIGYKRILRIPPIHADKIQLIIKKSNNTPAISNFGLYKASPKESVIQAASLLGNVLYSPEPSEPALEKYAEAKANYEKEPDNPDALIWYGRRTAYLGNYREAIEIYTDGIEKFPEDARMYRHRGHRYISIREFDNAIKDFEHAATLIAGKEDSIEPDGMPNPQNIPVSSLHTNIWYHLGLAYYLKNDLENALRVYREGIKASQNDDMLVATTHWLYMTLRLLGREDEAKKALQPIHAQMNVIENTAYHRLCLFYKGLLPIESLTDQEFSSIVNDAVAYGVGNWYFYNDDVEKAKEIFQKLLRRRSWASFGYIAAESDFAREFR
jgi:alpha-L-fucosidase